MTFAECLASYQHDIEYSPCSMAQMLWAGEQYYLAGIITIHTLIALWAAVADKAIA